MKKFKEKFEIISIKIGNEKHLLAIRDSLMSFIPFLVLAGFITFINWVFLSADFMIDLLGKDMVGQLQALFGRISNGTLNIFALALVPMIAYNLSVKKEYDKPFLSSIVSLTTFFVVIPFETATSTFGTTGILLSIIVSITATELFIKLSSIDKLKIKIEGNVPPAIIDSFNSIISISIILLIYAVVSFFIKYCTGLEVNDLIYAIIQAPLVNVAATLPGALLKTFIISFLFFFGIHPGTVTIPVFDPVMIAALETGSIVNQSFVDVYNLFGGSGSTLGLVLAILLFAKRKELKSIAKMALPTSLFNINEPVIFGIPICFNPFFLVPFIIVPLINVLIAYVATVLNLISIMSVYVHWSTPPLVNAYIASAGDIRNVVLQIALIVLDVFIYLVFLKSYEKSLDKKDSNLSIEGK